MDNSNSLLQQGNLNFNFSSKPDSNELHHQRAGWRKGQTDDWEHFFKQQFSSKTHSFKNQAFLDLCAQMNIDPEELKPKNSEFFMYDRGNKVSELVGKTRFQHFNKKRYQSLAILKVRMDDMKSGEMFCVSLNSRFNNGAPKFDYLKGTKIISPGSVTQISNQFTNAMTNVSMRPNTIQNSKRTNSNVEDILKSPISSPNGLHLQLKLNRNLLP